MLFPWYGFKLGSPLSATALDSFNFGHLALLITAAAVTFLLAGGRAARLPRPLSAGGLLIAAGIWSLVIIGFLIADPPNLLSGTATIGGVRMRYGAFVAIGAAAAMIVGGMRSRHAAAASAAPTN